MFYRCPDGEEVLCRVSPAETLHDVLERLGMTRVVVDGCAFLPRELMLKETLPSNTSVSVHRLVSAAPVAFPRVARQLRGRGYALIRLRQALGFLETVASDPDHILRDWLTKILVVPAPGVAITLPDQTRIVPVAMIFDPRDARTRPAFSSMGRAPRVIGCSHFVLACPNRHGASLYHR